MSTVEDRQDDAVALEPVLDEEIASNLQLALETEGTADEVDSSDIRPAPAPTARDLRHSTVDVSSSQPIDSTLSNDSEDLAPLDDIDAGLDENHVNGNQFRDPVPPAGFDEVEFEQPADLSYDTGTQSPAHRTLELPPALDLTQTERKFRASVLCGTSLCSSSTSCAGTVRI